MIVRKSFSPIQILASTVAVNSVVVGAFVAIPNRSLASRFPRTVVATRALNGNNNESESSRPFRDSSLPTPNTGRDLVRRSVGTEPLLEQETSSQTPSEEEEENNLGVLRNMSNKFDLAEKFGTVDESRLVFPELASGEVDRVFSNISYERKGEANKSQSKTVHMAGSIFGAAALVTGTTIGAGILALPTATAPAGFLPSSFALAVAWVYMTISGLLIAELSINRIGETGKVGVGLLDLYKTSLGKELGWFNSAAFLSFHYAVMVAFISQGGANLGSLLSEVGLDSVSSVFGLDQFLFVFATGSLVYFAKPSVVEKTNNVLVGAVVVTFLGIIATGAGSADFPALIAPENQHPEMLVNAFPICFLSMVYHNIVPTVVTQLEGDKMKITKALVAGTTVPFLMFLAWNAIILGNIVGMPGGFENGMDPIGMLQNEGIGGETLGNLVSLFSGLAVTTTLIGFIYGMIDALTDVVDLPVKGPKFEQWKPALFAGALLPPLFFSLGNPEIFYDALDWGGAFGVSTLFLVLPPLMVWKQRYIDDKELTVSPMVPFGKIPLASLWKAAGTLIVEQGADKLGVFDFFNEVFSRYRT